MLLQAVHWSRALQVRQWGSKELQRKQDSFYRKYWSVMHLVQWLMAVQEKQVGMSVVQFWH